VSESPFRNLPSVDALAGQLESALPRPLVVETARLAIESAKRDLAAGGPGDARAEAERLIRALERSRGRNVINATGVILHTNLGRAPWSDDAIARAGGVATGYGNIEIDLESGERGRRGTYVERLLRELTGAESAMVVNNNAAGLLLALAATASGRAVPVARGELIEIGGSYRLPDVMGLSGALMVEVGTTNRTRLGDYVTAIHTHRCGALLKVHPSNYRVEGFTEQASVADLAALSAEWSIPLIFDQGSGLLDSALRWLPDWIGPEPGVRQALEDGAGLVTFSGDKLLGGPQAGLIVGDDSLVAALRRHPLSRALRVDGVTLAALAATLEAYLDPGPADLPLWRMALLDVETLTARAETVAAETAGQVELGESAVGAGSAPGIGIPSPLIRQPGEQALFDCLLRGEPPVLARREAGDLLIDLRTVDHADDVLVAKAILGCR
jgi:L-seryl-tRNA(Ser) seleniumtransferase